MRNLQFPPKAFLFLKFCLILLTSISFFGGFATLEAAQLNVTANHSSYDLSRFKSILVDPTGQLSMQEAYAARADFKENSQSNFGFTNSTYWILFQIENQSQDDSWFLELAYALNDEVILYQLEQDGSWSHTSLGERYSHDSWPLDFRHPVFPLKLSLRTTTTYLLKVNNIGTVETPLTLHNQKELDRYFRNDYLKYGGYFGVIIGIGIFNLFLFFSLKDKSYLYFVLSILGYICFPLCVNGIGFQFFWGDSLWFANRAIVLSICFSSMATLLFTRSFLMTKEQLPRIDHLFQALILADILIALWALLWMSIWTAMAVTLLVFPLILGFWIAGVLSWKSGYEPAKYYILAWLFLTVGALVHAMKAVTILPMVSWTDSAFIFGAACNVVLFSFGLAERFSLYRKGVLEAKEDLLKQEKQHSEELELKVHKRTAQLEKSNEMLTKLNGEKDYFLNVAAHDLKSPLANLSTMAVMASQELSDGETEVQEYLSLIQQSSKTMSTLVGNILDIDRIEAQVDSVELSQVNLISICQETVLQYLAQAKERGMRFKFDCPEEAPLIVAEPQWANQVIGNLISNAMKFSPNETTITIGLHQGDGRSRLFIADQGPGIRPKDRGKLFTKFGRFNASTHNEEKSTGLGLHSVKLMMIRMGGEVYLDETYKEGAKFVLAFKEAGGAE